MDFKKCLFSLSVITVLMATVLATSASANIGIGPLTKTIQVEAGKSQTVIYRVANEGKEPINLNVSARTWFSLPENSKIAIDKWLNLGMEKLTLAAGEKKELKFTVNVPKEAKGELAAMIYFAPERKSDQMVGTSYGVSLYVFVKGTEVVEPKIGAISITKKGGVSYLAVTIENKGNVHFRPSVTATAKVGDSFKEDMEFPFGRPVFGGQDYTLAKEFKGRLPEKGTCNIEITCNYGNSKETVIKKSATIDLEKVKKVV